MSRGRPRKWVGGRKSETKKNKRERKASPPDQANGRASSHQHDECEKRVITGHMITTRYISTCKNLCTLHSFLVRLPPISASYTLYGSSSASLDRLALPTTCRSWMCNRYTKDLCWCWHLTRSREPWCLWLIRWNRKQRHWRRMGLTSCCSSLRVWNLA